MSAHAGTRALVIGGTQGLGLAIAERLVAEGCRAIAIAGRDPGRGAATAAGLAAGGARAAFLPVDMADASAAGAVVEQAADRLGGPLTALVNAAAATDRGSILDATPELWDRLMAVTARGPFFALQAFARAAIAAGIPAAAVNILSMVIHCGQSFLGPYSASKAALANVTRNAANALRRHRIRVNGIACGWMDTPGEDATQRRWHGAGAGWLAEAEARQPFGRLVKPAEVAGLAAFMLAPAAGVMTGAVVDFDQNVAGAYPE